jgi:hypothetical protein
LFDDARTIAPLVVWLASGGSFFQYAKSRLPIPLTRKACHVALTLRSESSLLRAIRKAQVLAQESNASLAHAWASSVHAAAVASPEKEAFFATVLEWLAARDHCTDDVAVMLDYAAERFTENAKYSMKGRTVDAFLRDARAWHVELTKMRMVRQSFFRASGFKPFTVRGLGGSPGSRASYGASKRSSTRSPSSRRAAAWVTASIRTAARCRAA